MDAEPPRLYNREWKVNKPYLPKSTSLPLLRLVPEGKAIFVCKQCGFSNLLVPMCLWCCWSSAEAQRDFEARATKTLRRAARSAPRLFNKPMLSTNSHQGREVGAGKHHCSEYHRLKKTRPPHGSSEAAVKSAHATISSPRRVFQQPPWFFVSGRGNRGKEEVISGPRKALIHRNQGPRTESGIDDCGTGSTGNNYGPTRATIEHLNFKTNLLPANHQRAGYHHRTESATTGSSRSTPLDFPHCPSVSHLLQPRLPLFRKPPLSSPSFSVHALLGSVIPSKRRRRRESVIAEFENLRSEYEAFEFETSCPIGTLPIPVDAPATDTRCDAPNAFCPKLSPWTITTHKRTVSRHADLPTAQPDPLICNYQEIVSMDGDIATVIHSNQAPTSPMNHAEAITTAEQPTSSDMDMMIDTTITKTCKKRAPIPSILLHQDSTHTDTPIASQDPASQIPNMSETTTQVPPSPARLLKRKKRLSLIALSGANNSGLVPPCRSPPLSPPPLEYWSPPPQPPPTFPVIVTPPESPSQTCSPPGNFFSPSIVISPPASITPMMIEPSRPIPSPSTTPIQTLPRIGTPKRPYYSTVRANNRPASSVSPLSTPPASPSSSSFSGAVSGGSRLSPTYCGTPGSPDQCVHLDARGAQRPVSLLTDTSTVAGRDDASGSMKIHRPASTSAIDTVPPLSPVMVSSPIPIPIPVQMRMRPSSPARSILSVLDPAHGDEEGESDDEAGYNQFGMSPTQLGRMLRKRKSSNLKEKVRGDGKGYHFPLSLPLSLGRKRGRLSDSASSNSGKEKDFAPAMPILTPSRSYNGLSGFSLGRGCSMSGEMEMKMALAERSLNANGGSGSGLEPAFKFRESPRPSYDGEDLARRKSTGKRLMRMRSTIGLSSSSLTTSPPSSPSKPKIGSKLKEMSASFLGRFQGDGNRS